MKTLVSFRDFDFDSNMRALLANSLELFQAFDGAMQRKNFIDSNIPYNLLKTDTGFTVEVALAGFDKDEISVSTEADNTLCIVAEKKRREIVNDILEKTDNAEETNSSVEQPVKRNYIHRGIAFRSITKKIRMPKNAKVAKCHFKNGLLIIDIAVPSSDDNKITHEIE